MQTLMTSIRNIIGIQQLHSRIAVIRASGFVLAVAAFWMSSAYADQITRKSDNVTLRGEFTDMNTAAVAIKLSNGKLETVPVSDIRGVRFDQEPALLSQAQSNERSGSLDAALQKYRDVQKDPGSGDKRVAVEVEFLIARTLVKQALADPALQDEAKQAISKFRSESKSNFRYLESCLLEASIASATGDSETAKSLLQEVQSSTVRGFQLQAGVQLGRLLLQSNSVLEAQQAFEQVISQSTGDPGSVSALFDGMLGKALCLQQQGQLNEALNGFEDVIAKASESDSRVLAEAWNRKGDCLRQQNEPKAAMMAYLHVDVLYSSEPAEHAQALFRLSQLWGPTGHPDRAEDAASRLAEKYPNSSWAKQLKGG